MARAIYFTASTLDGFLADENDSLAWLFEQETDEGGPAGYAEFIAGIGAIIGRTGIIIRPGGAIGAPGIDGIAGCGSPGCGGAIFTSFPT